MKTPLALTIFNLLPILAASFGPANTRAQEKPADGELTQDTYEIWRDHVLPRSWELKFQKIEWRTSFWEAVCEAQEKDMPILLWTMNGHPLCNT
ncbi:MAG: hypothetical protein HKN23_08220 [Verrucomicrobiales bacterium]|nr:hypothetical protein [Verrucomicrobiales bacterium]